MKNSAFLQWDWQPRSTIIQPQAALGFGVVAEKLLGCLRQLPEEHQEKLQLVAADKLLLVLGKTQLLPWIDGIEYAAPDTDFAGLWLPTAWQPTLTPELILQALKPYGDRFPLLLWRQPKLILPLDKQGTVTAVHLDRIETSWKK